MQVDRSLCFEARYDGFVANCDNHSILYHHCGGDVISGIECDDLAVMKNEIRWLSWLLGGCNAWYGDEKGREYHDYETTR